MPVKFEVLNIRAADARRFAKLEERIEYGTGEAPKRADVFARALDALERELEGVEARQMPAVWAALMGRSVA